MNKSKFENFINKYNLAGSCESVLINSDGKVATVRAISGDRNVVTETSVQGLELPEGTFAVYETQKLKSMLNVLSEDITVEVGRDFLTQLPNTLTFCDSTLDATFSLADHSVLPTVPSVVEPKFDLTVPVDEQFINTFIRAKTALPDAETFTVISDGKTNNINFIVGNSTNNTNRIKIKVTVAEPHEAIKVSFSAKYLKHIFTANKDIKSGTLFISNKEFAKIEFNDGTFASTYYLAGL